VEVREQIADFLAALIGVYTIIIIAWIVVSFVFALGARPTRGRSTRSWTSCAT